MKGCRWFLTRGVVGSGMNDDDVVVFDDSGEEGPHLFHAKSWGTTDGGVVLHGEHGEDTSAVNLPQIEQTFYTLTEHKLTISQYITHFFTWTQTHNFTRDHALLRALLQLVRDRLLIASEDFYFNRGLYMILNFFLTNERRDIYVYSVAILAISPHPPMATKITWLYTLTNFVNNMAGDLEMVRTNRRNGDGIDVVTCMKRSTTCVRYKLSPIGFQFFHLWIQGYWNI